MREYTVMQRGCTIALNTRAREEENMVDVTTRAKETLAQMKESANVSDPDIGLRLEAETSGGFGLFPDKQKPGDQIVEYRGAKVLLIEDSLAEALTDARIDCKTTGKGPQLVIGKAEDHDPDQAG